MPMHTIARVCFLENYKRYFHATTCQREVLSSSACMYNLNASTFYIAFMLLHEYFTHKAKLLPYTTELSLQTWSISFSQQSQHNDRTLFKTASLQVQFFAINDVIASVVAVKFGKAFCYGQDITSGNRVQSFVSFQRTQTEKFRVMQVSAGLTLFGACVRALINIFITYKHIHNK